MTYGGGPPALRDFRVRHTLHMLHSACALCMRVPIKAPR